MKFSFFYFQLSSLIRSRPIRVSSQCSQIPIARLQIRLLLRQPIKRAIRQAQRILNHLSRRQRQPLADTHIGELPLLQHLQHHQILVARVLDEVRVGRRDIAYVTGRVVEGLRAGRRHVDGDAAGSLNEVVPLVGREVPVHLAHPAGFDGQQGRREIGGDGEGARVDYLDGAAGRGEGLLLRPVVSVGAVGWQDPGWARGVLRGDVCGRGGAVEDIELRVGQVVEC